MATTTNFGWNTPDNTDLVKDGALAIRTLGNAIDTSLVDLKGGTTGQVLTKASNTEMDFTWSSVDPLVILDAKGDLITATAADTPARLAVGTNGQVLTADSTTSTGLRWSSPSSGGLVAIAPTSTANTGGTVTVSGNTVTVSAGCTSLSLNGIFSSTYRRYRILWEVTGAAQGSFTTRLRASGTDNTASDYAYLSLFMASAVNPAKENASGQTGWNTSDMRNGTPLWASFDFFDPFATEQTLVHGFLTGGATSDMLFLPRAYHHNGTGSFDGLTFTSTASFTGRFNVYGYAD